MRPPKQKQPQVKKGLCRVLEYVDVDVNVHCSDFDASFLQVAVLNSQHLIDGGKSPQCVVQDRNNRSNREFPPTLPSV